MFATMPPAAYACMMPPLTYATRRQRAAMPCRLLAAACVYAMPRLRRHAMRAAADYASAIILPRLHFAFRHAAFQLISMLFSLPFTLTPRMLPMFRCLMFADYFDATLSALFAACRMPPRRLRHASIAAAIYRAALFYAAAFAVYAAA